MALVANSAVKPAAAKPAVKVVKVVTAAPGKTKTATKPAGKPAADPKAAAAAAKAKAAADKAKATAKAAADKAKADAAKVKEAEKAAAAKLKEQEKAAKAAEKEAELQSRAVENEGTRRQQAIEGLTQRAYNVAYQETRMNIFIERLTGRINRSKVALAAAVDAERARQAAALEKYPSLKTLKSNAKELEAAAALPTIEIPEAELPAYITNIKDAE